jgi:glycosyltransferase involved in cell wall biosynthesis
MPSCVDIELFEQTDSERDSIRRELGVSESDVLVVYAGGSQQYQILPQMFRLWEAIAGDSTVHFLALTHGPGFSEVGVNLPTGRSTHMEVDRDKIPGYLSAADIGFLLRAPHPLNTVASPIKFGEYLASGLSVVSSPGIGDISQTIEQRDLGILVDAERTESAAGSVLKLIDDVRTQREAHAERSRQAARDTYDWGAYVDEWKEMLSR